MNKKNDQSWHAISVSVPAEGSDWISHLLFELGSVGNLEEEVPNPAVTAMKGYFPTELGPSNAIIQSIIELLRKRGIEPLSTFAATIKIQNWAEQACQMFSPIKILDDFTIINPWSSYSPNVGEKVVVINPGMAFGTGLHATTQISARLMSNVIDMTSPKTMCDCGSGSGILSIIAAKMGVQKIEAVEIDLDARISAEENIKKNDCADMVKVLKSISETGKGFEIVVANILYATIIQLKDELIKRLSKNGNLIISGITKDEDEKFTNAFVTPNIKVISKEEQDGWMGYHAAVHDR